MRKYELVLLVAIAGILPIFMFQSPYCPLSRAFVQEKAAEGTELKKYEKNILGYLKAREDALALREIDKALARDKDNPVALWAKAELLRRNYKFKESEEILKKVLEKYPDQASSLISLAYIRYHDNQFGQALKILRRVLTRPNLSNDDKALAYMLAGSVNAKRSLRGGLFGKFIYGTRIKGYFEKAKALAPDLAEVRLGLGTFYLLAPAVAGGNVDKAISELEAAIKIAPDFATAKARLAQAYQKKGDVTKCNFYLTQAKELDPDNEAVKEIEGVK